MATTPEEDMTSATIIATKETPVIAADQAADPQIQTQIDNTWFVVRSTDGTRSGKKYPNCHVCETAFKPLENEYVIAEEECLCAICECCTHAKCAATCKRCSQIVCKFCGTAGTDSDGELCLYCLRCIAVKAAPPPGAGGSKRTCSIDAQEEETG